MAVSHTLVDVLDDLAITYISFQPDTEFSSVEQLLYSFKEAWYKYLDEWRSEDPTLPSLSFPAFVSSIVERVKGLEHLQKQVPEILARFNRRNAAIPVYGAALLNTSLEMVLLIQASDKKNNGMWMFPRGKLEHQDNNDAFQCARREVFEETSYDISRLAVNDAEHYVEAQVTLARKDNSEGVKKTVGLFIVPGVDDQFAFHPQNEGEVEAYAWFRLEDLVRHCKDGRELLAGENQSRARYLHVKPFIHRLVAFASARRKPKRKQKQVRKEHAGTGKARVDSSPLWATPSDSAALDFDAMLAMNNSLRGRDMTKPYEGVRPAYQLEASRAAAAKATQSPMIGLDRGQDAVPGSKHEGNVRWDALQMSLPTIVLDKDALRCPRARPRPELGLRDREGLHSRPRGDCFTFDMVALESAMRTATG